jgi:branched-subunit amino acid aminotransferase/4-amino-4-deoxychorismate lyase
MTEPIAYLNGRMIPAAQACLPFYDAGVVQGATVSELTRTFHKRLWRLDRHLDRLSYSLDATGLDIALTRDQLSAISEEVVGHNARLIEEEGELGLIHVVTAGEYATYAGMASRPARTTPTVCIHTFPLPFELWARKMREGQHLITPSIRHLPPQCCDPKMKCRSRMHFYLADREAHRTDPQASALLLDLDGNVAETNAANFFIVKNGLVATPTTRNTLPGISRAMIFELCATLRIPCVERDFPLAEALGADEAFTTSTPYCLMPVTQINGMAIGTGNPGGLTERLLAAWSKEVGLDVRRQIEEGARHREEE